MVGVTTPKTLILERQNYGQNGKERHKIINMKLDSKVGN